MAANVHKIVVTIEAQAESRDFTPARLEVEDIVDMNIPPADLVQALGDAARVAIQTVKNTKGKKDAESR